MIMETKRWDRFKESMSQVLCVVIVNGDSDEMLSSYAWRTQSKRLIGLLDWLLGGGHCYRSYEWEKSKYNVKRFEE